MHSYSALLELVNAQLSATSYGQDPAELYDPIRYMMGLGGKRLRPVLVLMGSDMFSDKPGNAIHAAAAIEVFHNFTLVHDDIMDNAPLRRGKETVYKKYSLPVAILSGDLMLIRAVEILMQTQHADTPKLLSVFNKAAAEVCEGQQIDMNFESRQQVTHEEYIHMIRLKTAVLLGASLQLGALIGGASEADAQHLYEFGTHIGIAFQIQDDILDSFGETAQVGKRIGGDIAANKKTLLLIELEASVHKDDQQLLRALLNETNEDLKIAEVLKLYNKYQIRAFAEKIKADYLNKAYAFLDQVQLPADRKEILLKTAQDLMERMN